YRRLITAILGGAARTTRTARGATWRGLIRRRCIGNRSGLGGHWCCLLDHGCSRSLFSHRLSLFFLRLFVRTLVSVEALTLRTAATTQTTIAVVALARLLATFTGLYRLATIFAINDLGRRALDNRLRAGTVDGLWLCCDRRETCFLIIRTVIVEGFLALERHRILRHGRHDDAVVMFSVLKIVFCHHAIARCLCVPRKCRVFFCNMLRIAADLHIRAIAFVIARQRIGALAVIVVIIVIPPSAHAPVLLCWPHIHLFSD